MGPGSETELSALVTRLTAGVEHAMRSRFLSADLVAASGVVMEAVIKSFLLVVAAEMGDKTQLLAFVLACRFRKPWTIFSAIVLATVANHGLAAAAGTWLSAWFSPTVLKWTVAAVFFAFSIWILIPDKEEEFESRGRFGVFLTTLVAFFMAEMGDKTQLATIALAMKYQSIGWVTLGTTAAMMVASGLPVFFGDRLTRKLDFNRVRKIAALMFFLFGVGVCIGF